MAKGEQKFMRGWSFQVSSSRNDAWWDHAAVYRELSVD